MADFPHSPSRRARRSARVLAGTILALGLVGGSLTAAGAQTISTLPGSPNDTVPFVAPSTSNPAPAATTPAEPATSIAPPATTAPAPATTQPPATTPPTTRVAQTAVPLPNATVPVAKAKPRPPATTKPAKPAKAGDARPSAIPKGATSIDVDISSQTLRVYKNGKLYRSVHVSTGSGKRYCEKGSCGVAHTPRGRFRVYNRISGWRTSRLGRLYNPLYFTGGYAIHGSGSVPNFPASHGCVRISMATAAWLPSVVPNGTPVWVHD